MRLCLMLCRSCCVPRAHACSIIGCADVCVCVCVVGFVCSGEKASFNVTLMPKIEGVWTPARATLEYRDAATGEDRVRSLLPLLLVAAPTEAHVPGELVACGRLPTLPPLALCRSCRRRSTSVLSRRSSRSGPSSAPCRSSPSPCPSFCTARLLPPLPAPRSAAKCVDDCSRHRLCSTKQWWARRAYCVAHACAVLGWPQPWLWALE